MRSKVQLWGNSLAMRIPKFIANQININNGSEVEVSFEEEKMIVEPVKTKRESLEFLLSKINEKNIHKELDFGPPVGGEIW
ncbi:AbrB/MazE/SpoVT family DNA-binding domain-containing protein [bacterium]|nr:AbrB/MazE/SpoVT family DNA-binding domain-containing protein [bacterium]